jgi:hypothetical protein
MYLYGIQIAATNLRGSIHEIEPEEDSRRIVLTRTHDEIAESETILEEDDPNYRHKDDCECDQCTATETDTPHHPNCQCGECHLFEQEQESASEEFCSEESFPPLTIQAKADNSPTAQNDVILSEAEGPARTKFVRIVAKQQPPLRIKQRHKKGYPTSRRDVGLQRLDSQSLYNRMIALKPVRKWLSTVNRLTTSRPSPEKPKKYPG